MSISSVASYFVDGLGGGVTISGGVTYDPGVNQNSSFCISTGGPATTVSPGPETPPRVGSLKETESHMC